MKGSDPEPEKEFKPQDILGLPLWMKQQFRRDLHRKERRDKKVKKQRIVKPKPKKTAVLREKKRKRNAANTNPRN